MGETRTPLTDALGPVPAPGDRLLMVVLHPSGQLEFRASWQASANDLVQFLRSAADDLARGTQDQWPDGLIIPGHGLGPVA